MSGAPLMLGVDGGATHCRARLRDAHGKLLAEASGAAANIHVDFAAAVAAMRAAVDEVLAKAGLGDHGETIALGFGLAGFKQGATRRGWRRRFPASRLVCAANDATTACIGAHAGADGGLVIAGTGSAAIARVQAKETIIGGRGFALGDDGSGSHIGLEALRSAMRAHDGLEPASALTEDLLGRVRRRSGGDDELGASGEARRFRRLRAARVRTRGRAVIRSRSRSLQRPRAPSAR